MDNAAIHHGEEVVDLIREAGSQLEYLPPYSPNLNHTSYLSRHSFCSETCFALVGEHNKAAVTTTSKTLILRHQRYGKRVLRKGRGYLTTARRRDSAERVQLDAANWRALRSDRSYTARITIQFSEASQGIHDVMLCGNDLTAAHHCRSGDLPKLDAAQQRRDCNVVLRSHCSACSAESLRNTTTVVVCWELHWCSYTGSYDRGAPERPGHQGATAGVYRFWKGVALGLPANKAAHQISAGIRKASSSMRRCLPPGHIVSGASSCRVPAAAQALLELQPRKALLSILL
nr:hypothetical protein CFP56_04535 [Quercus suber]